jgi:hypothetical protein
MKPFLAVLPVLVIGLISSSCSLNSVLGDGKDAELVPVIIDNEYSMDIPSYMTKSTELNDDASLQFRGILKEAYVIVIDESKQEFVDFLHSEDLYDSSLSIVSNYAKTQLENTTASMNVITRKTPIKMKINGLNAVKSEIDGVVDGITFPISYFITFVESQEKLYMIMAWTLKEDKEIHRTTFERMAKTFKCLHEKPLAQR